MNTETSLWLIVLGCISATYIWRFFGAFFSRNIDPRGKIFVWITCVSYAMLVGLISRMIFIPVGPLEVVPLWIRLMGVMVGLSAFFLMGRNVLLSVLLGLGVFVLLWKQASGY